MTNTNAKRAETMYAVLFNEKNWERWEILMRSDDPEVKEAARALLKDVRSVLQEHLIRSEAEATEIKKQAAEVLGMEFPEEKIH